MSFGKTMNEKVLPVIMKFVNMKGIIAIKDGILFTLPLTLIGSIFLLIAQFPVPAFVTFMNNTFGANWTEPFFKVQGATMNIIALVSVFITILNVFVGSMTTIVKIFYFILTPCNSIFNF